MVDAVIPLSQRQRVREVPVAAEDLTLLPLSEVFGPTFQGEGPHTGVRTGFVRLGLCNLACEWCDTPYTWDNSRYDVAKECPPTTIADIHASLRELRVDTVCLSGGEPLMHKAKLKTLLSPEWTWHCETNGTISPPAWWSRYVEHTSVSPKVSTEDPYKKRIKFGALSEWNALAVQGKAAFKFVVQVPEDFDRVQEVADLVGIAPCNIWIMPEGTEPEDVMRHHRAIEPLIIERGWNTTTRLHTLLYGSERGR